MSRSLLPAVLFLSISHGLLHAAAPAGFEETVYINSPSLSQITGMAWAPDNSSRLFVISKTGQVNVVQNGQVTPFATLSVYTASECGLIGICFDPDFLNNRFLYLFVTVSSTQQQIVRLKDVNGIGAEQTVLIRNLPTAGANHDGGAIGIGPEGHLYWAIGDLGNGTGVNADLTSLAAKVGRANRFTGHPIADNPFNDGVGPNNEYIWARGFRNPFTMTFHPRTGDLWLNVVGTNYEQLFITPRSGHGGYNNYENNQPSNFLEPVIAYRTNGVDQRTLTAGGAVRSGNIATFTTNTNHGLRVGAPVTIAGVADPSFNGTVYVLERLSATEFTAVQPGPDATSGGGSMTTAAFGGCVSGGTFYESTLFPAEYEGNFFFGDFNSGQIMRAIVDSGRTIRQVDEFVTGAASHIDIATGPDGALYYAGHSNRTIKRLAPVSPGKKLVVYPTAIRAQEGGSALFTVRLSERPSSPVTVTITKAAGGAGNLYSLSKSVVFTQTNWDKPQAVLIQAVEDVNSTNGTAFFQASAPGFDSQEVQATEIDGVTTGVPFTELLFRTGESVPGEEETTTFLSFRNPAVEGSSVAFASVIREGGKKKPALFSSASNTVLVRAGDAAPGTSGTFRKFGDPIASGGGVLFSAQLKTGAGSNTGDDSGIWSIKARPGLQLLAREGEEAPGTGGGIYQAFRSLTLSEDGSCIFIAKLRIGSGAAGSRVTAKNDTALYRVGPAGTEIVVRENDSIPVPGAEPKRVKRFRALEAVKGSADQNRSLRRDGSMVLEITFTDGTQAIVQTGSEGEPPEVIAYTGDPVANLSEARIAKLGLPAIGPDAAAFLGTLNRAGDVTGKNDNVVLRVSAGGSPLVIAREGNEAPGTGAALFKTFSDPAFAGQSIVLQGTLQKNSGDPRTTGKSDTGLWLFQGTTGSLIARENTIAPGTDNSFHKFLSFAVNPGINPARAIAFTAVTRQPNKAAKLRGLWARGKDGTVFRLRQTGEIVPITGTTTATVATLHALEAQSQTAGAGRSVGQNGSIVYRASLRKAGQAIFRTEMP